MAEQAMRHDGGTTAAVGDAPDAGRPNASGGTEMREAATGPAVDLSSCRARIAAAERAVSDLCHGRRRWTMSIPARPDEDPDLVIGTALSDARWLAGEVERLTALAAYLADAVERLREIEAAARDLYDHTPAVVANDAAYWQQAREQEQRRARLVRALTPPRPAAPAGAP